MATRVFFLNKLATGVDRSDYERWVRERDYPTARAIPSIRSYDVVRLDGPLREGDVPYDYVEVVEVADLDDYRADLAALPGRDEFVDELRGFVGEAIAVYGTTIE
jgi:REDY-like protein HapK